MSPSFDLNADSAFEALKATFDRFKEDALNEDLARDCAIKAWHLCEHVFRAIEAGHLCEPVFMEHAHRLPLAGLGDFKEQIKDACPELAHLEVICNASKHGERLRNTGRVKKTQRHDGAFSQAFSRDFDVSGLQIVLTGGTKVDIEHTIETAVSYWFEFLSRHRPK